VADADVNGEDEIGDIGFVRPGPAGPGSRKSGFAISKMPPPPTRTIALGDKLPAIRPTLSDDESEESAEEEDPKSRLANAMPDTSRSSRRPPVLRCHKYDPVQVQTQSHSAVVCAAGHVYVAASGHHVKVYDLSLSESPILILDGKDVGLKELKATSLEFCPANAADDKGRYVWIGTKDGHMYELDVITGKVTGTRLSIHLYAITRILRYGDEIISLDDSGKVTIWTPEAEDLRLASAQIRGSRISDRQGFVEMLAGKLWTSAREATAPGARGPAVRIYDILTPGSATRSVLPTEHVGTVTSGTILPSHPNHVYLGHEGGFVTIWSTATEDSIPVCEEVMRISNSDVLCLAGINDRLWVGGRNGTIAAYSVESRPWVMTNNWVAHWNSQFALPLQKIAADPYSIEKIGRLCVYSVGRDDHVKSWDGLLGADWQGGRFPGLLPRKLLKCSLPHSQTPNCLS
jgi:WD40 repeat protein